MSHYFTKTIQTSLDETLMKVMEELKREGLGILTEIDVRNALRKKLEVDSRDHRIQGDSFCKRQYVTS